MTFRCLTCEIRYIEIKRTPEKQTLYLAEGDQDLTFRYGTYLILRYFTITFFGKNLRFLPQEVMVKYLNIRIPERHISGEREESQILG